NDDLVGAPIPDAENGSAEEDAGPRELRVRGGLDHVEVAGRNHGAEVLEAADTMEADDGQSHGAGDENQGLDGIGVDDRSKAAGDGVDAGGDDEDHGSLPERPSRDALEDHAGGIELHGNFGKDVGNDGDGGEVHGALAAEAALEKFGHGEDVGPQIERNEDPAEDQKNQAGQPLEVADREAGRGARAGKADEMLG